MEINEEKLEALLANRFELDFINIKLTQQKDNDPVIYSGSGSIIQKSDGNFHLKLYHVFNDVARELFSRIGRGAPGKIIEKEEYFSMEAVDMSGNVWKAKDIYVSGSISLPASGRIIESIIRSLSCEKSRDGVANKISTFLYLVIAGKHDIPCNKWEEDGRGGGSLNTCELSIQGIDIEIKDRKNCLIVRAEDPSGKMDFSFKGRFVEALSIIFGKLCPALYFSFSEKDVRVSTIASIPAGTPNQSIATPIKHNAPWEISGFHEFIEKYFNTFELERDIFFGYWHKINRAWQGGVESAALTISTAIEGIAKHYYSEYGFPDQEILQQAEDAKILVNALEVGQRIKSRIESSLGQVKASNPKNALYGLAKDGRIEKELVDCWVSLRNKSAHADRLDDDMQELQKYIDDVYKCQNLFNVLYMDSSSFANNPFIGG